MGSGFTVDPYRDSSEGGMEMSAEEPDAMHHSAHEQLKPDRRDEGSPSVGPQRVPANGGHDHGAFPQRTPRAQSKLPSRAFNPPRASPPAS